VVNTTPVVSRQVAGPMPLPSGSPAPPALSVLLPQAEHVLTESWVRLNGTTPQVVVTDSEPSASSANSNAIDLVVYAWDNFARRWVSIFDAAQTNAPNSGVGGGSQQNILPTNAAVENLTYATITPSPGRTDLAFWAGVNFGANSPFDEYIIHYDGQTVSVAYSNGGESGTAHVIGVSPDQQLSMTAEWIDPVDAECCAVRNYTQTVGWNSTLLTGSSIPIGYQVVVDTRSWLGVFVATKTDLAGTPPPPVVMTVVPGSPAVGLLEPGDQLISVAGIPQPSNQPPLGPAIIDQIDSQLPGTRIALTVERAGQDVTENATLSSYANPAELQASVPSPAFLGVDVATSSPSSTPGAYIQTIVASTAATQAGLRDGDVITSLGTKRISDPQDLTDALLVTPAGTTEQLVYVDSAGTSHAVTVQLGSYPSPTSGSTLIAPIVDEI
jgi:hypothetical protein